MKTAVRLTLALYPRWWQRRYGREMEALLEDSGAGWAALFDVAQEAVAVRVRELGAGVRRPSTTGLVLIPALVGTIAMCLVAMRTPSRYRSEAVLELAARNYVPTPLTLGKSRLASLQDRVMTQAKLGQVIKDLDLYHRERQQPISMAQVTDEMRQDIGFAIDSSGDGNEVKASFRISYASTDPRVAQKVADRLAALFLEESTRDRLRELELARLKRREEHLRRLIEIAHRRHHHDTARWAEATAMETDRHDESAADLVALRQEYRSISSEYQALLAETTAVERPREYFTLRDAPPLPTTSIGPNRLLMIATGAAVGLVIGFLVLAALLIGRSAGSWHATPSHL